MNRQLAGILVLFFLWPDPSRGDLGEAGGLSLLQPPTARSAALGEAFAAVSGSAECLGYNPAGLGGLAGLETGGLYYQGFAGDRYMSALIGYPLRGFGLAARLAYYDSGSVVKSDETTGELSSVSAQRDLLLQGAFGHRLPGTGLSFGLSGKILHTVLIEEISGSQVAADIGVTFDIPHLNLSFGAALQNLGPSLALARDEAALPLLFRAGAAYRVALKGGGPLSLLGVRPQDREVPGEGIRHRLLLLLDVPARIREEAVSVHSGLEYTYAGALSLRAGYRSLLKGAVSSEDAVTAGAGARVRALSVDYAVEVLSFAVMHRFGLTYIPAFHPGAR